MRRQNLRSNVTDDSFRKGVICDVGHKTIGVRKVSVALPDIPNQEKGSCPRCTCTTPRNPESISNTASTALSLFLSVWCWLLWLPAQFLHHCLLVVKLATKCRLSAPDSAKSIQLGPLNRGPLFTPSTEGQR